MEDSSEHTRRMGSDQGYVGVVDAASQLLLFAGIFVFATAGSHQDEIKVQEYTIDWKRTERTVDLISTGRKANPDATAFGHIKVSKNRIMCLIQLIYEQSCCRL